MAEMMENTYESIVSGAAAKEGRVFTSGEKTFFSKRKHKSKTFFSKETINPRLSFQENINPHPLTSFSMPERL